MKLVVLLSCMNQSKDIIQKSNIQTDVIIINQCEKNDVEYIRFWNKHGKERLATFVSTKERGLSRSRNMAISMASEYDIGLFCDDDELFSDNYEEIILNGYMKYPEADLIAFPFKGMKYIPDNEGRMGFKQLCSTSSIELSFRINKILKNRILFDPTMGSGSGNGAGEEVKFMMDCRRNKLELYYIPTIITELLPSGNSQWFNGRNTKYIRDAGWSAKKSFGYFLGFAYIHYHLFSHYKQRYKDQMTFISAFSNILKGFFENRN